MKYRDFEIQLSRESPNHYSAKVMDNGNAIAAQTFELRTGELKVLEGLQRLEERAIASSKKETFHIEFGKELYNKVFAGKLGEYFKNCLEEAQNNNMGLRICLRFDKNAQEIAVQPWEFLHDGRDFLVTSRNTLISRLPSGIRKIRKASLKSILRMLVVISKPDDPASLNTELEQEVILEAVDKLYRDNKMEVDFTDDATFETIQSYLKDKEYHIVHFTGHGIFYQNKGYLVLETGDGKARMVDNSLVTDLLKRRGVRLVVLSACQSGKTSNKEAYADLASILAKNKIPAVVAMQYSILDLSATKFASIFYQAIASGKPVDLALTEARITMKNAEKSNGVDFATPVLYLSDPDCLAISKIKPDEPELFNKPAELRDVAIMKKGFVGRNKELRILQKDFMSDVKRAAIIYGFGGLGKTVLATRLALRMNQYFEGMFGMRCSATTKPEDILNRFNAFLLMAGIQQLNKKLYKPVQFKKKTDVLVNILNQRRFLIILDNFEDCLDESRSNIASSELKLFIQHLLKNTKSNSKFIITTRYNFDPLRGKLTESIEHISLPELPFTEAIWLMDNYKELADLEIGKKRSIYEKIGGHPMAIGLFSILSGKVTVDGLLQELAPLKQEVIRFTLLDKSYTKLDEKTRALFLHASVFQEAVPYEALSWIVGDETQPNPPIRDQLSKLIDWGLIAKQDEGEQIFYLMHTLVRDFAQQELEKKELDRKNLLIRAAQYYENLAKTLENHWDDLTARKYYFQAEEWNKADDSVLRNVEFLVRRGYIEMAKNLLNESIKTTSGNRKAVATGNLAVIFQNLGNWKTALKIQTEVKEILGEERQTRDVAATLHNIGAIYQAQGNYQEAIDKYQQSLKIKDELGDQEGIAITLYQLGNMHTLLGNYQEAIDKYQQSMKISEELGDQRGIAFALHALGMIHYNQGKYPEAIDKYQQSMKISEKLEDQKGIAFALHAFGMVYQAKGKYPEAIDKYQQSMKISEKLGDKEGIASTLHQLGNIHYDQGNYQEAIDKYQQSMKIKDELGDQEGIAITLYQLGMIHYNQGNYQKAIDKYQQSIKISKKLGGKRGIAQTLHALGMVYQTQGKYPEAIVKYRQSMKISEKLGDKEGIASTLHHQGMVYQAKGNYQKAIDKYQKSMKISEELDDQQGIAQTLGQLGNMHTRLGNYQEAIDKYQQSMKISEELGDQRGIAFALHNLGGIHQQQGDYPEAINKYQQSIEIKDKLGDQQGIANTLFQLAIIYEEKDFPAALEKYITAFFIFKKLESPNAEIAGQEILRLKKKMGEEAFNKAVENIMRAQEASGKSIEKLAEKLATGAQAIQRRLTVLLDNTDCIHLIGMYKPQMPGIHLFATKLEYNFFPPGTSANNNFSFALLEQEEKIWSIISVPKATLDIVEKLAPECNLRLVHGVPTDLGQIPHSERNVYSLLLPPGSEILEATSLEDVQEIVANENLEIKKIFREREKLIKKSQRTAQDIC